MSKISLLSNLIADLQVAAWSIWKRKGYDPSLYRDDIVDCLFIRWSAAALLHDAEEKMKNAHTYYIS